MAGERLCAEWDVSMPTHVLQYSKIREEPSPQQLLSSEQSENREPHV